jgi:hypothetical protein
MDCSACDGELVPGAAFCGHCGAAIPPIAETPDPIPPGDDLDPDATSPEGSGTGARRPRRLRYLVAVAAAVVLVVGVALARPDSGGDDQVAAAGPTSTTTAGEKRSDRADQAEAPGDQPGATEESIPADVPAPDGSVAPNTATPNPGPTDSGSGQLASSPPPPSGTPEPPPPPPPPPPPSPPGPAALIVVSDCVERCVIDRGGRVELRVINFGGQAGRFTIVVSEGIDPRPRQGSVGGGETRVVELVETAGKRRAYRVDVLDENGVLLFRTSVSVGG